MRKKLVLAVAIVALGAIAFAATSLASDRPSREPKITKIEATPGPNPPEFVQVDVDGNGSTADIGDQVVVNQEVYDRTGTRKLGDSRTVCTVTDPGKFGLLCVAVTRLADGEIHGMAYADADTETIVGSEIGGTGRYRNVRGWHEIPPDGNSITWYLLGVS